MRAFLAKYDPNGGHIWSKEFVCSSDANVTDAAFDSGGNVLITGYFSGAINFGGGDIFFNGGADAFVAKFSPSGTHLWSQGRGGFAGEQGLAIAVDSRDNVLVTGNFFGSTSFGVDAFGVAAPVLSSPAGMNVFIAKYTPAGAHIWSKSFGGLASDAPYCITTDSAQNILVVGTYASPSSFGGTQLGIRGSLDVFIAKYNERGDHVWSESVASVGGDYGFSVVTDPSNNVIVTGQFEGGPLTMGSRTLQNAGGYDGFLYRRTP